MSKTRGFAELLPYMTPVTEQVVVCKDSGLLATYEIGGKDLDSISDSEIESLLSNIETALYPLRNSPWKVWFTLKRFENDAYPDGFEDRFDSDPIACVLDETNREFFNSVASYSTKAYVSFYLGAHGTTSKFSLSDRVTMMIKRTGLMMSEGKNFALALGTGIKSAFTSRYTFAYQGHEIIHILEDFEKTLENCSSILTKANLRRLKGPEFLGFLRSMSSGYSNPDQEVKIKDDWDWFLDSVLPDSRLDVGSDTLRLGDNLISALSIKEWPANTDPNLIPSLMSVNSELTFSCAFNFLDVEQSKKFVSGVKSYADLTKHKLSTYLAGAFGNGPSDDKANRYSLEIIEDAEMANRDISSGERCFGFMNITMLVQQKIYRENGKGLEHNMVQSLKALEAKTSALRRTLSGLYPGIIREEIHLLSAWASTLPGNWEEPVRWSFMNTANLADSAPVLLVSEGERVNEHLTEQLGRTCPALTVFPTPYNTPFYFNFHQGALAHTMVIGPSRAGKSVLMNFLISQWRKYAPCRAVIFDKDYSCRINTLMHDGEYFDLKEGANVKLNPISLVDSKENWEFLVNWIANLISFRGHIVTSEDEKDIRKAIEYVSILTESEDKRLFSISTSLPEHLRIHLETYVDGGQLAHYFDNSVDNFSLTTLTAFEMGELMGNPQIAGAFIDYAFYRIMQTIKQSTKSGETPIPTLIYLEEFWFLIEVPAFRTKVRDWLKTLAKLNAFLIMTTQSLEDMTSSDDKFFASLRDNIPTKIFLPNAKAKTEKLYNLYTKEFGVDEHYLDLIQNGIPKRDYLIVTDEYSKQIVCQFNDRALAILRSDTKAQALFNARYLKTPDWKTRYIYDCTGEEVSDIRSELTLEGEVA